MLVVMHTLSIYIWKIKYGEKTVSSKKKEAILRKHK